jgi:class 3 adenylate cyclase/YHS domain-containing protein
VYADGLARVADAEARLFHFYVYARLRTQGFSAREALEAAMAERFIPMSEPNVLYFHRKGWQKACRDDAVLHLEENMGRAEDAEFPGQLRVAVAFVDLSDFTALAEAMGDDVAARVLERFSRVVRDAAGRWEGRVIKQIGDAFMMVFHEAREAVECLVEIDALAAEQPQFPAVRGGIHFGPVLYREGDYFGSSVNITARLVAEAERHQVLVTDVVRKAAAGSADVEFIPLGRRRLRGIVDEVELFAVERRAGVRMPGRAVDPVCGMELDAHEIAARLSVGSRERVFCSEQCLQRFVAAPEHYTGEDRRPPAGA